MRITFFISLTIFQFLFINPYGLDGNQSWGGGNKHEIFKKYNSEKSLPVFLIKEEVKDSDNDSFICNQQFITSVNYFSFYSSTVHSFRSGLFSSINSLNLRILGFDLFHLNRNLRL